MAAITSAQSGNWSAASTWVGGVKPGAGDAAIIATGHTVTVDENTTVGSKAAAVGHGITINATNATTYGKLTVNSGVALTLRGYDKGSNKLMLIGQYAKFEPATGAIILLDLAADSTSYIYNNGHIVADGVTVQIPTSNINWDNASGIRNIAGITPAAFDATQNIYIIKINTSSRVDPGPISNAAGTGLGSFGDSSLIITSQTNGPATEVPSYAGITTTGHFYVDYPKGLIYYKNSGILSVSYSFKYASWYASGIIATTNQAGNSLKIINSTLRWLGSYNVNYAEYEGGAIVSDNKYVESLNADRRLVVIDNLFEYCQKVIVAHNIVSDASHLMVFSGNTFRHCRNGQYSFDALFYIGYSNYFDINNNTFDSFTYINAAIGRGNGINGYVRNNIGRILHSSFVTSSVRPFYFEDNDLSGFGGANDDGGFETEGDVTGSIYYRRNKITNTNRAGRLGNYMVVTDNIIKKAFHHGFVHRSADGYLSNYIFSRNIVVDSYRPGDMGGGWTLGYNRTHWIDNVEIANNTFDTGNRSIQFNDTENTKILGTRLKIYNNIASNSLSGIYRPPTDTANITKLAVSRLDFNNDYNNTTIPTNIKQATFIMSATEYNLSTRNCSGVYLHSPTYTLPQTTGRSLDQANSGTAPTNLSVTLAWGGGAPQQLVLSQGTSTGGTTSTLVDTNKSWVANTFVGKYVKIISGMGAGQVGMIAGNTSTSLSIIANNTTSVWAIAPDATSVYIVMESEVTLIDPGAAMGVNAGLYLPDVVLAPGTYTDTGITITTNAVAVDPQFNASFTPTNPALKTAGFGGTYIGALDYMSPATASPRRRSMSLGFNFGF